MKVYKVVPCANDIVVNKNQELNKAVETYFDVINQEAVDGWEFHSIVPLNITRKMGGLKNKSEAYNAFLFYKEV